MTHDVPRVAPTPNDEDVKDTRKRPPVVLTAVVGAVCASLLVAMYVAIPSAFGARAEPVTISCALSSPDPREGEEVKLTYAVDAEQAMTIGLSVQVFDHGGRKHANGTASVDSVTLEETFPDFNGRQRWSKEVRQALLLPANLDPGTFQVIAEAWPAGRVGAKHTSTLSTAQCGYVTVPDQ